MKTSTLSALVVVTSLTTASGALAQDAAAGKTSFNKCLACHAVGEGAKNKVGPVLNGLDGRKSGTVEGYNYSDANKNSGITWNKDVFLEYIKDPKAKIPGTKMVFAGIKNENEANNLWAYVASFDKDGKTEVRLAAALHPSRGGGSAPVHAFADQASVCTITGPAIAVAGPVNSGARSCSIHASARLLDSSAAAKLLNRLIAITVSSGA